MTTSKLQESLKDNIANICNDREVNVSRANGDQYDSAHISCTKIHQSLWSNSDKESSIRGIRDITTTS